MIILGLGGESSFRNKSQKKSIIFSDNYNVNYFFLLKTEFSYIKLH